MEPTNHVASGEPGPGPQVPAEAEREDEVQALSYGFINVYCLAVQHVACVMLKWDSGEMCGSEELTDACMMGAQHTGQAEIIDQHKGTGKQLDHGIRDFPAVEDSPGSVNWHRA
ncbi:unnamed protein product [Caretta caretta]